MATNQEYYMNVPAVPLKFGHDCRLEMNQDERALQDSLINVNTVRQGECYLNVRFGSRLSDEIFEQNDDITYMAVDTAVRIATDDWENRIEIRQTEIERSDLKILAAIFWRAKPSSSMVSSKIGFPYGSVT